MHRPTWRQSSVKLAAKARKANPRGWKLGRAGVALERRTFRLNSGRIPEGGFVIHFRAEVICDAESLFARFS